MPIIDGTLRNRPVWFDCSTSDLEASKRFYTELFGWRYDQSGPEFGNYAMAFAGERAAAAIMPKMPGQEQTPVAWTVFFGVEDARDTATRIAANGGQVMAEPMAIADVGTMAVVQDPDGAVFGLWQAGTFPGARIEGEHGAMCWCEVNSTRAAQNAAFYGTVFGLTTQRMDVPDTEYYTLHQGEPAVAGVMQMDENWAGIPPHWMPYFTVRKLAEADDVVRKHGGTFLHGPIPSPYGTIMVVRDPQGAVFSYMSTN